MNSQTLLEVAEYLTKQAEQLRMAERLGLTKPAETPNAVTPFGTYADGQPKPAPAYDACKPMWEAAQRVGAFDIHKFIGVGVQEGAGQMYSGHITSWKAVEDAIVELGKSEFGQTWLSFDQNAELIQPHYLKMFRGYTVKRVYDKAGDLVRYDHVE